MNTAAVDLYGEFSQFFNDVAKQINSFKMTHTDRDELYGILKQLVLESNKLNKKLIDDVGNTGVQRAQTFICNEIKKHSTTYRRNQTYAQKGSDFVQPCELAIGMKWKSDFEPIWDVPLHDKKQCTYHYVPITNTLKSLFSNENFKKIYLANQHQCVPGVYERFCCGNIFQTSEFFKSNPNAIQLRLFLDDFEICCPIKTKNVIHKLCGIYFQIGNMPRQHLSKLKNIYLIALCESSNLHQTYASLDNILAIAVNEMKNLSSTGIDIGNGLTLKAALAAFIYDNLGGNHVCGFTECFSKGNFCRHCVASKADTEKLVNENIGLLRTIEEYDKILNAIKENDQIKLSDTIGVKKPCVLNDLDHYHILINKSVDPCHDCLEGIVPMFLYQLLNYCVKKKFLSENALRSKIRDFNYGALNSKNLPSFIDLKKTSLGQNASQLYILMIHIPFILIDYETKLEEVKPSITSILKIMQIIRSDKVTETDVVTLENNVELHHTEYMKVFKEKLRPKHHNITHYASTIRASGSVKDLDTIRFEGKHKVFTNWARETNNFINIPKTLAIKHQQQVFDNGFTYVDEIHSASTQKCISWEVLENVDLDDVDVDHINEIDFFSCNSYQYKIGFFIVHDSKFWQITHILTNNEHKFWFVCVFFEILRFNDFCNSFEIKKSSEKSFNLISFENLANKTSYEKKYSKGSNHIIVDTLDISKEIMMQTTENYT